MLTEYLQTSNSIVKFHTRKRAREKEREEGGKKERKEERKKKERLPSPISKLFQLLLLYEYEAYMHAYKLYVYMNI